jgi:hypothetical protein
MSTITSAEIKWLRAALQSDTTAAANGGRMTLAEIASNVKNALFPDVSKAQREAGATHWRKVFVAVRNSVGTTLMDAKFSIEAGTPGDSYYLIYPSTQDDTQDEVTARPYGYGTLADAALAEATSITVTSEVDYSAMNPKPFQVGDLIRIDARANVGVAGNFEYREIDAITYTADEMAITLTAGLEYGYDAGVHVASVIEAGDLSASVTEVGVTGTVTYTAAGNLTAVGLGVVYQAWTVTILNATTGEIKVEGDTLGQIATGALGANLAPANPANGAPYFSLRSAGWGGTPANGDTLTFTTTPAAQGVWYKRVVPAGSASIASDPVWVCVEGESS